MNPDTPTSRNLNRRRVIRETLGAAALVAGSSNWSYSQEKPSAQNPSDVVTATNGRIKQSIAFWCFNTAGEFWDAEKTCAVAKQLGCLSVEIIDSSEWEVLKKHGLTCAMSPNGMPGPPFVKGFNNPRYHDELISRAKEAIDDSAAAGFPNVSRLHRLQVARCRRSSQR